MSAKIKGTLLASLLLAATPTLAQSDWGLRGGLTDFAIRLRDGCQSRPTIRGYPAIVETDDGETIRVPVRAEEVDVRKDARVVEEVEISKRPVTETQRRR